MNGVVPEENEC